MTFANLCEAILASKKFVQVGTPQRFQGKCVSFSLAFSGAKLFIRSTVAAVASAVSNQQVPMSTERNQHTGDFWIGGRIVSHGEMRSIVFFLCPVIPLVLLGEAFSTFQKVTSRLGIIGAPKKLPFISLRKKC